MIDFCLCLIIKDDINKIDINELMMNIDKTFGKNIVYKIFFSDYPTPNIAKNEEYKQSDFKYAMNMCKGRSDYILYLESDQLFETGINIDDLTLDYYVDTRDTPFLFKNRYSYNWELDNLDNFSKGQLDTLIVKQHEIILYTEHLKKFDDWEQYEQKLLKAFDVLKRVDPLLKIAEHYRIKNQHQKAYDIGKKALIFDYTKNNKILDELGISSYFVSNYIESFLYINELLKYVADVRIKNNLKFAEDKLKNYTKKKCLIDIGIYRKKYDYTYILKLIELYKPFFSFSVKGIGISNLNIQNNDIGDSNIDVLICFNNLNIIKAEKVVVWLTEEFLFLELFHIDKIVVQDINCKSDMCYKINTKGWEFFNFMIESNQQYNNIKKLTEITEIPQLEDFKIAFTITTCKRYNLFEKTMDSFLKNCLDANRIDQWICIDDNSSEEDRDRMKQKYPFMDYILKNETQKGHAKSMNILLNYVKADYIIHFEDDWICDEPFNIVEYVNYVKTKNIDHLVLKTIAYGTNDIFDKVGKHFIHNYHYNKNSSFKPEINRLYDQIIKHNFANIKMDRNGWWWPGFTLNPSIINLQKIKEIGYFNDCIPHELFEYDYAARCFNSGYNIKYIPLKINHVGHQSSYNLNDTRRYYD